jgi:hypothetical protein
MGSLVGDLKILSLLLVMPEELHVCWLLIPRQAYLMSSLLKDASAYAKQFVEFPRLHTNLVETCAGHLVLSVRLEMSVLGAVKGGKGSDGSSIRYSLFVGLQSQEHPCRRRKGVQLAWPDLHTEWRTDATASLSI